MRSERGLALFLGLVVVLLGAVFGLPLFTLAERAQALADGCWPPQQAAAELFQRRRGSSEMKPSLLEELLATQAAEPLQRLARENSLSRAQLLAFLAIGAGGASDSRGFFLAHPLGMEDLRGKSAAELSDRAAAQLGELKRRLGSFPAALLAWKAGPERVGRFSARPEHLERKAALFLPQPLLDEADAFFCRAELLRQGLEGVWPSGGEWSEKEQATFFSLPSGGKIRAPLPGKVLSRRSGCVVVEHRCGLFSEFCGVRDAVPPGKLLQAGEHLAEAAGRVRFMLLAGSRRLQPPQLGLH
jgi:hypothetical protein